MNAKAILVVAMLAACGGTSPSGPLTVGGDPDAGTPPPAQPVALKAGTYKAKATTTARALTAPAGPAIDTTFITDGSGAFSMVFPNYDFVRGGNMVVNPDGTLSANVQVLVHQDGTFGPADLAGTSDGTTIVGTISGDAASFDLTRTDIQDQDFTVAGMAGNYLSTSSSTGLWMAIAITPDASDTTNTSGNIAGYAYATEGEALVGDTSKAVRNYYAGRISKVVAGVSTGYVIPPNVFNFGVSYRDVATGAETPATYGFAYFMSSGLVALTVNPYTGEQFTAEFAKR